LPTEISTTSEMLCYHSKAESEEGERLIFPGLHSRLSHFRKSARNRETEVLEIKLPTVNGL